MLHNHREFRDIPLEKRRDSDRRAVSIRAEVKQVGDRPFTAFLRDLSCSGFQLSTSSGLRMNQTLHVRIPGLQVLHARLVWRNDFNYGCQFTQPLYQAVFEHIVSLGAAGR